MLDREKERQAAELARRVMALAHNTLLIRLRFMDAAVGRMEAKPGTGFYMATDGENIYYDPIPLLKKYKEENNVPTRDYLHTVLHCVFHHNFSEERMDPLRWDLACDVAVENAINNLNVMSFNSARVWQQASILSDLGKKVKHLTAENIYHYFLDHPEITDRQICDMQKPFSGDDHWIWYNHEEEEPDADGAGAGSVSSDVDGGEGDRKENSSGGYDGKKRMMNGKDPFGSGLKEMTYKQSVMEGWKDISERIQEDLETFSQTIGSAAGSLLQNIREVTREKYDYTEFLKKFSEFHETMKINDDEFDYNFYTYGLDLYGDMPLIEPLEYKDVKRIKEIAIVIDTSGSVQGEEVQSFLQKTYNILKNRESFFTKFNLHIIQCDVAVREDKKITCQEEFDAYVKDMKLRGFGGTDFRPAFDYVDKLMEDKEFTNLKGLLYFTDGYGIFPTKPRKYQTAFIFVKDDPQSVPAIPAWAIKLVLPKRDLR